MDGKAAAGAGRGGGGWAELSYEERAAQRKAKREKAKQEAAAAEAAAAADPAPDVFVPNVAQPPPTEPAADGGPAAAAAGVGATQPQEPIGRSPSADAVDEVAEFPNVDQWTVDQVITFLCSVNSAFLTRYEKTFRGEKIQGSWLNEATKEDLVEDLEVKKLHAGQIIAQLGVFKNRLPTPILPIPPPPPPPIIPEPEPKGRLAQGVTIEHVVIFQDSENAFIGNLPGLKPERVYENAVDEIFVRCNIDINAGATKPKVKWTTYFPPIKPQNPWHCSQSTLTALRTAGVLTLQCGDKKGDVDTQMKDAMTTYITEFASNHPKDRKAKTLMVLLSGTLIYFKISRKT